MRGAEFGEADGVLICPLGKNHAREFFYLRNYEVFRLTFDTGDFCQVFGKVKRGGYKADKKNDGEEVEGDFGEVHNFIQRKTLFIVRAQAIAYLRNLLYFSGNFSTSSRRVTDY